MPNPGNMAANGSAQAPSFPMIVRIYAETLAMVGAATLLGALMGPSWGTSAVDLLYLLPVLAAASLYGLRPALFAGATSALAYNFFFTHPIHTFRIDDGSDVVTVVVLFAVAVVTSHLAAGMRRQARLATASAARNATVAGFARQLMSCSMPSEIGRITCDEMASLFACNAVLVVAKDGEVEILASAPAPFPLTPSDVGAAAWVLKTGESAGKGSSRLDPVEWRFYPVASKAGILAAIGLARDDGQKVVAEQQLPLLGSLLDQTALGLERAALEAEMREVTQERERERLRRILLSSVGHDLRTPLTAIVAAADALRRRLPDDEEGLIAVIDTEARRLERYVSNLLDMARVEAGAIRLKTEPVDLIDAAAAAMHDMKTSLRDHQVGIEIPPDLPLVSADPELLHHILINLLDNAARYSAVGSGITIAAGRESGEVTLSIVDEGPGLAATGELEIFGAFEQLSGSDRKGGAGLGLAIVSGFAEAMGLSVSARNRGDRQGASFTLHFPAGLLIVEREEEAPV